MAISFLTPPEHMTGGVVVEDSVLSSCGRPYPMVDIEILDTTGKMVPSGKSGEICVHSDLVMKGYYRRPYLTAAAIVDGWRTRVTSATWTTRATCTSRTARKT